MNVSGFSVADSLDHSSVQLCTTRGTHMVLLDARNPAWLRNLEFTESILKRYGRVTYVRDGTTELVRIVPVVRSPKLKEGCGQVRSGLVTQTVSHRYSVWLECPEASQVFPRTCKAVPEGTKLGNVQEK